jgi:nucleotide-binding universal stress UspA family protein
MRRDGVPAETEE